MIEIKVGLKLHENQKIINSSKARFVVIKAGKRFGKTKLALYRLFSRACDYPGDTFWYLAPSYRHAKNIAWRELLNLIPRNFIRRKVEQELMVELHNGSLIQLVGCDNEDALRGPQLRAVVFDEAAYIKPHIWPSIISGQLLGHKGLSFADFISSPNKDGANWFTDFHAEAKRRELAGDLDWASFYFTIYDNPTLTKEEVTQLKDMCPDDIWELEYMAKESALSGPIVKEFETRHLKEYQGESMLSLYRGLDWGMDHPTACLWAKLDVPDKQVYISDEYIKSGSIIMENAETIKQITGNRPVELTVCDPSMAKRNSQTGRTDMIEFARYGIPVVPGDNNHRGYDVMKMFFKRNMISVAPKCKNLIYQLRNVVWGQKEGEDLLDCLRYLLLRIHDTIHGMNVLEAPQKTFDKYSEEHLKEIRELNINNLVLFPKEKREQPEWVMNEIMDY